MSLADGEHSAGAGVDVVGKQPQGLELQAVLGCQPEIERIVDFPEERDRIHRGHPGVT